MVASFRLVALLASMDQRSDALRCAELDPAVLRHHRPRFDGADDAGEAAAPPPSLIRSVPPRRSMQECAMNVLLIVVLPALLLVMGVPIFVVLMAADAWRHRAQRQSHPSHPFRDVRQPGHLPAARGPAVHLCRRYHGARRHRTTPDRADPVARRRVRGFARYRDHCGLRSVQRDVRLERGLRCRHRQAHHPRRSRRTATATCSRSAW